jgi:hypothetical protein
MDAEEAAPWKADVVRNGAVMEHADDRPAVYA